MHKINLLLADADRRGSSLIEAAVLDACYELAAVECHRTSRVDELLRFGPSDSFQLIIVAADCLHAEPSRRSAWISLSEVIATIRTIKQQCSTPVLAFDRNEQNQVELLQAGVDGVLSAPGDAEQIKAEVRRVLRLAAPAAATESAGWSLWTALLRGLNGRRA